MPVIYKQHIDFECKSHPGMVEEHNHDFFGSFETPNGLVLVICGGIKDNAGAAIASKIAVSSIGEYFESKNYKNLQKALYNAILFSNQQVFEQAQVNERLKGMSTTLAVVLISDKSLYYAYVGNSRIYILKNNKLQQLTKDHVKDGLIVNKLGESRDLKFSISKNPLELDDKDEILLTSDGITGQLSDKEIYNSLCEEDISIAHKAAKLIDRANAKGGKDNATVIFARYDSKMPQPEKIEKQKKINPWTIILPIAGIILAFAIYFFVKSPFPERIGQFVKRSFKKTEKVVKDTSKTNENIVAADTIEANDTLNIQHELLHDTVIVYRVKKDENLFRIALHFNLSVDLLAKMNSIKAESLSEGQKIQIPVKGIYMVEDGDLIFQIAKKLKVNYKSIIDANKLNTYEYLEAGNYLYIPYQKGEYQIN